MWIDSLLSGMYLSLECSFFFAFWSASYVAIRIDNGVPGSSVCRWRETLAWNAYICEVHVAIHVSFPEIELSVVVSVSVSLRWSYSLLTFLGLLG